jgi:hypothetical protein
MNYKKNVEVWDTTQGLEAFQLAFTVLSRMEWSINLIFK